MYLTTAGVRLVKEMLVHLRPILHDAFIDFNEQQFLTKYIKALKREDETPKKDWLKILKEIARLKIEIENSELKDHQKNAALNYLTTIAQVIATDAGFKAE